MSQSAFGVEHGEIDKSFLSATNSVERQTSRLRSSHQKLAYAQAGYHKGLQGLKDSARAERSGQGKTYRAGRLKASRVGQQRAWSDINQAHGIKPRAHAWADEAPSPTESALMTRKTA